MSSRTRALVALAFVALLVLFTLLFLRVTGGDATPPPPAGDETRALRPGQGARAGRARASRAEPATDEPANPTEDVAPVLLTIHLGDASSRYQPVHSIHMFRPARFWPTPEEAPLPEGRVPDLLQRLMDSDPKDSSSLTDELLRAADEEGLVGAPLDLADRPWEALVALEVERIRRSEEWMSAIHAIGKDDPARWELLQDLGPLQALADELCRRYPGQPVADFAGLYALHTRDDILASTHDEAAASRMALSLLAETEDPMVADHALALLVDSDNNTVPPEEVLAVLDAEYDGLYEPSLRTATAQLALDQVLATGDGDQAAIWLDRFQRNVTERCADLSTGFPYCDEYRAELAAADG